MWGHIMGGEYQSNGLLAIIVLNPNFFKLVFSKMYNFTHIWISSTVKSLFAAAATIHFDEILVQNLLSKNYVLLRLLFKGGYYLRAATNKDFTVH